MNHINLLLSGRRMAAMSVGVTALVCLSACHTTTVRNLALDDARQTFNEANANPDVVRDAPLELDHAREALSKAEQAQTNKRDQAEVSHLAYLAKQQSQVAVNVAIQHEADNMVTAAGVEREKLQAQAKEHEVAAANERAMSLERQLAELSATRTDRGMVLVLQDVLFDVGKSYLRPGSRTKLERVAAVMREHPERRLLVEGFTDSTGRDELNQQLSEERARAVAGVLIQEGISADRINAKGYGKDRPVATNSSASGRAQNRRVEIVFSDAHGAFGGSPS